MRFYSITLISVAMCYVVPDPCYAISMKWWRKSYAFFQSMLLYAGKQLMHTGKLVKSQSCQCIYYVLTLTDVFVLHFRVYCFSCIDSLAAKGARKWIHGKTPWPCFLCSDVVPSVNGIIKPRPDCKNNDRVCNKLFPFCVGYVCNFKFNKELICFLYINGLTIFLTILITLTRRCSIRHERKQEANICIAASTHKLWPASTPHMIHVC
jgi:hypothetical protein